MKIFPHHGLPKKHCSQVQGKPSALWFSRIDSFFSWIAMYCGRHGLDNIDAKPGAIVVCEHSAPWCWDRRSPAWVLYQVLLNLLWKALSTLLGFYLFFMFLTCCGTHMDNVSLCVVTPSLNTGWVSAVSRTHSAIRIMMNESDTVPEIRKIRINNKARRHKSWIGKAVEKLKYSDKDLENEACKHRILREDPLGIEPRRMPTC